MPAPFVPSRPVHIVGVGSCLGAPIFGPAAGPRALRALGLDAQLRQRGVRARWEALFEPSAPKPPHPPMPGLPRHAPSVEMITGVGSATHPPYGASLQ